MSVLVAMLMLFAYVGIILLMVGIPIVAIVVYFSKKGEKDKVQDTTQYSWEHKEIPKTNQAPKES